MIKRNCIKVLIGVVAATSIASCGDSGDHDATPTATLETTPPTESSVSPTTEPASGPASTATTTAQIYAGTPPPTIVFDDSAARQFWTPVPAGATPEQWQPEYLTREELTRYEPLVDPDPASWDIPPEGITPEYAKRVLTYLLTLESAILKNAVTIGPSDLRVSNSTFAIYAISGEGTFVGDFNEKVDELATGEAQWRTLSDVRVEDIEQTTMLSGELPCMFVHVTYALSTAGGSSAQNQWFAVVRDATANWLNPTKWRLATTAPNDIANLRDYSCEAGDPTS